MQVKMFQSPFWGEVKKQFGWGSQFISIEESRVLIFSRYLFGAFCFIYIPYGFESMREIEKKRLAIIAEVKRLFPKALFIRFDLIDSKSSFTGFDVLKKGSDVQPPDTVILDLTPDEDFLLKAMHKKTRYNIKLAQKRGVEVSKGGQEDLQRWYKLYEETAKRDKIAIHSSSYYQKIFELAHFDDSITVSLYLAEHHSHLLAGIIVLYCEDQAYYLYGASSNFKRNLMPAYALQWLAICEAKRAGLKSYDFFGIPPEDNPAHPMYGLYRFKTGFGAALVHRAGTADIPLNCILYPLFRFAEKLRLFYYKKLRKR